MHQSMQRVLKSENSQKKTGIYLKLNLGLKALLVINGLMSWVLLDRGDIVFRNHSTLWTVRRDLLSRLSEFQLMSNISRTLVPKSRCCSPSQSRAPCSEELEKCVLEGSGVAFRHCHLQSDMHYFCPSSLTPHRNFSLT